MVMMVDLFTKFVILTDLIKKDINLNIMDIKLILSNRKMMD